MKNPFLFLAAFLCLSMSSGTLWAAPGNSPDHVHYSWQNNPATTITGVWRTVSAVTGTVIEVQGVGTFTGTTHSYAGGDGIQHTAEATGLTPDTAYTVRVGDGSSLWSDWDVIETAPLASDQCAPYRFVVMGDSRSITGDGVSIWWSTILDSMTDDSQPGDPDPDFLIHTGDIVAEGDEQDAWDEFFEEGGSDLASQPLMAVWGNHDDRSGSKFLEQMAFPTNNVTNTEDFYSFRYGNGLFLMLDTERTANPYQTQDPWIQTQFDDNTDAIWKFAFHHRPAYSSGSTHGSDSDVQDWFVPLFESNGLDVDFGSHDHIYQRTCFINNDACVSDPSQGVLYYVTGGAGAFMNPISWPLFPWFSEKFDGVWYHYILVQVEFNKATFTTRTYLDTVLDEIVIEKEELGYPTAAFTGNPTLIYMYDTVTFDGSASLDPCGEIIDWAWDFGDGQNGNGETVDHEFTQSGTFTVTLTVTDLEGFTHSASADYDVLFVADDDDDVTDDDDDTVDDDDDTADDDDDTTDDDVIDDDDDTDDDSVDDDSDDDVVDDDDSALPANGDDDDDDSSCCG